MCTTRFVIIFGPGSRVFSKQSSEIEYNINPNVEMLENWSAAHASAG